MSLKYVLLCLVALGLCVAGVFKSVEVWTSPVGQVSGHAVEKHLVEKAKTPEIMEARKDPDSLRSPALIAEKNIFSPERKNFSVTSGEQPRQIVRPQVVLYGVTIAGDYQAASVSSPGRPLRKGERETLTLKVGERMGAYQLAKVSADRITLQASNDTFEVLLYDSKKPKRRIEAVAETPQSGPAGSSPFPSVPSQPPPRTPLAVPLQQAPVENPKAPVQRAAVAAEEVYQPQSPLPTVASRPRIDGKRRAVPH